MNFRLATAADAPAIATLHADSWQRHYRHSWPDSYLDGPVVQDRQAVWEKRLRESPANQFVMIAEEQGVLQGFTCAYGADDAKWGTLLDNLHVRHDLQGRGTGATLVREVARWSRANYPECDLYLWALEANTGARRLYERLGAKNAGTESHMTPGGGRTNAVRYSWTELDALIGA
ncbi:MAG: GNAT family N-acetyltransferase [Chloroflexota bacterium]